VRELNGMDKKMQILKENVKKRCGRDVMSSKTSKSKKINLKELLGGEGIMLV
jgi:L-lactate utilization protein LutB